MWGTELLNGTNLWKVVWAPAPELQKPTDVFAKKVRHVSGKQTTDSTESCAESKCAAIACGRQTKSENLQQDERIQNPMRKAVCPRLPLQEAAHNKKNRDAEEDYGEGFSHHVGEERVVESERLGLASQKLSSGLSERLKTRQLLTVQMKPVLL